MESCCSEQESKAPDEHGEHGIERSDLARIGLVAVAAGLTWAEVLPRVRGVDVAAILAAAAGSFPICKEAVSALAARRMTMELSMSIAVVAALAIGELFTGLVIILFVLIAEALETLTVGRGRKALKRLTDLLPRDVLVRREGGEQTLILGDVRARDLVIVKPGGRVPVDGLVEAGHSSVDQAAITGEAMPVDKAPGSTVFAGTFNHSGVLEIRATSTGRDTVFGRIVDAVENAERSRAPIQKTADRLAGYLVYFALACAALTFAVTRDARATISVVIVAGACGIAAGTPLAILGAIGQAAARGVIVKGGRHVETLAAVETVVFDKTGTLTFGKPRVVRILPQPGVSERELLESAAACELRSEHPVARAILDRAADSGARPEPPESFAYAPGMGVACECGGAMLLAGSRAWMRAKGVALEGPPGPAGGCSEVLVARSGRLLGAIHVADVLRHEAVEAIRELRKMGIHTVLLTGDAPDIAASVGSELGIDESEGGLLPEAKVARVRELLGRGGLVAMVGDGVNDAPALAQASVGVAMCSGTDVAMEVADVVLLGDDLSKLVETIGVSRSCRRIIAQNFVGTIAVDLFGMAMASLGHLNPMLAAFIHVTSELGFIANSARLLPSAAAATKLASVRSCPAEN